MLSVGCYQIHELKAKGWVIEDTQKGPKLKKI
jgi:hypothetical protein